MRKPLSELPNIVDWCRRVALRATAAAPCELLTPHRCSVEQTGVRYRLL